MAKDLESDANGGLGRKLVAEMSTLTWHRIGATSAANARRNGAFLERGQSIAALRGASIGAGDSAIIVGTGPSLKRRDPAKHLGGYKGAVVCTERAMFYLLKNRIIPDLVVTVNSRVTADDAFATDRETNRQLLALLDEHGSKLRIAVSTSASPATVDRVLEKGMQIFWWNPMLDDPDEPGSVTRKIFEENRLPCINGGGNVGTSCWMMATEVLGKKRVALTAFDLGYYPDTPYEQTLYYKEALELVGEEKLDEVFMHLHNPDLNETFYTDPAYMWYRECFLQMVAESDAKTYNCTEGGIVFGPGITTAPLAQFVAEVR